MSPPTEASSMNDASYIPPMGSHPSGISPPDVSSPRGSLKPTKAYKNQEWLNSRPARHIRILCELMETGTRLTRHNIAATILFFGSARCLSQEDWTAQYTQATADITKCKETKEGDLEEAEGRQQRLDKIKWMIEFYDKSYVLAEKLTDWANEALVQERILEIASRQEDPVSEDGLKAYTVNKQFDDSAATSKAASRRTTRSAYSPLCICTGGGPGLMEAANKGASAACGNKGRSMGMGISLPFECGLNSYVTPSLGFEFHYFFTRKFWMMYCCMGVVCTPGGLGTLDELMEVLTLKQTGKVKRDFPIVLLGKDYWKNVMNIQAMVDYGTISQKDEKQLFYTDSVDEAFEYITNFIMDDDKMIAS